MHKEAVPDMLPDHTALILIGYQNDYYAPDGVLHPLLENSELVRRSLDRTVALLDQLVNTDVTLIETPIIFTDDYGELHEPEGILAAIRDLRAFKAGSLGSARVEELEPYRHRILSIPGKRGLNAFVGTDLEARLRDDDIQDVVLLGSVASLCIDSTGRTAAGKGFQVHLACDCITGRTRFEHEFYCQRIFPLYAQVTDSPTLAHRLLQVG